jgi:hypothetical protein
MLNRPFNFWDYKMKNLKPQVLKMSINDIEFILGELQKPVILNEKLKQAYEKYRAMTQGNNNASILK